MPDTPESPKKAQEQDDHRGRLKIFFGYAPGVGKTYAMLDESQRRHRRGQDVVVGYIDAKGREGLREVLEGLDIVPSKFVEVKGATVEEMDTEAIIARKPSMVLVDDLAHQNAPGMPRASRWEDVEAILDAGISVLSNVNVQSLESLNDQVAEITGVRVKDTVPDRLLHKADEIELVDLTTRALIHRLERGDILSEEERVDPRRMALFDESVLSALRELALREVAGKVDEEFESHKRVRRERPWAARDRVMICITPGKPCMRLIRRGWRMGQRMRADVTAVYVEGGPLPEVQRKNLDEDTQLAQRLDIPVIVLRGPVGPELVRYARENSITHIVLGRSDRTRFQEVLHGSVITTLVRELKNIDFLIVSAEAE